MKKEDLLALMDKYLSGRASPQEEQLLHDFYDSFGGATEPDGQLITDPALEDKLLNRVNKRINESDAPTKVVPLYSWGKIGVAAVFFCLLAGIFYIYFSRPASKQPVAQQKQQAPLNDIDPGGDEATLTLADNSKIILDATSEGVIADQAGIKIRKTAQGELVYTGHVSSPLEAGVLRYNTITTPKGGKFKIILPDGSIVWLNAASSLRYPVYFPDTERRVDFSGEAYFEIAKKYTAKDKKPIPFYVEARNQVIEVLGTGFNISSYENEAFVKTTLIEGSVKVYNTQALKNPRLLKPGQQALTKVGEHRTKVITADPEQAVAWKDGFFMFRNTTLLEIMKEVERWYDVSIEYSKSIPSDTYTGYISRNVKLSSVLKMLEQSGGVKFIIKDKRIKVYSLE